MVWRFASEESGQGLVEYALLLSLIAVAVIVAMFFFRDQLANSFSNIGNNLRSPGPPAPTPTPSPTTCC